jgi:hypothetical protein
MSRDPHGAVEKCAEFPAMVGEVLGKRGHIRGGDVGPREERFDQAVAGGAGCEDDMPRLDVGVRRRADGQFQRFGHEVLRDRLVAKEQSGRVAIDDGLFEVVHVCLSGSSRER